MNKEDMVYLFITYTADNNMDEPTECYSYVK